MSSDEPAREAAPPDGGASEALQGLSIDKKDAAPSKDVQRYPGPDGKMARYRRRQEIPLEPRAAGASSPPRGARYEKYAFARAARAERRLPRVRAERRPRFSTLESPTPPPRRARRLASTAHELYQALSPPTKTQVEIKDVWASTLDAEMAVIRELVERYPYVAMDTEFPGVVAKPVGDLSSNGFAYQTLQCNVDLLKIIQLGISFCGENGETPAEGCYCYQFNFRFDLNEDMYAEDSIELLKQSGIDFDRHAAEGIDVQRFGELIMMSGLVLVDEVKWISFHSGYDFGYLLKILTCSALPSTEEQFFELLHIYFPRIFDVKLVVTQVDGLHGGLQRIAEELKVERVGPMHQAGSDSMLTNATFFRVVDLAFASAMPEDRYALVDDKYRGEIYGLGAHAYKGKGGGGEASNGHAPPANGHLPTSGSTQSLDREGGGDE